MKVSKSKDLIADVNNNGKPDPGDTIVYIITVENKGEVKATNVVIKDDYDQELLDQPTNLTNEGASPTPTVVEPTPPPVATVEVVSVSAGPTGEVISKNAQAILAVGFMLLALGGLITLGYLAYNDKQIPPTLHDGFILSLIMGTVVILGLTGSVERSAIAGLIGTVAGYVLRSAVEKAEKKGSE